MYSLSIVIDMYSLSIVIDMYSLSIGIDMYALSIVIDMYSLFIIIKNRAADRLKNLTVVNRLMINPSFAAFIDNIWQSSHLSKS